jgi:hypothetical protein
MNEKLRGHFLKIGPKNFVLGTVFVLIILDFLSLYNLKLNFEQSGLYNNIVLLTIERMQIKQSELAPETLTEMAGLIHKTMDFAFLLILINNLFFYFFYLRKKLWAQGYILFYTMTAAIFSLLMIFDNHTGIGWTIFNVLTIPIYLYLFFGVKLLKEETTLAPKKKGR